MKSIMLGLAASLLGGVALGSAALGSAALAQTPPPPSPPPALKQPAVGPTPAPPAPQPNAQATPPAPQGQQNAQNGQPAVPTPSGPPEGMIVETPTGFYLVRPGDPKPQRLDLGRGGGQPGMGQQGRDGMGQARMGMGQPGMDRPMMGQDSPAAMTEGDDAMGDGGQDGMQPSPPARPHRGPPPHPPEGKGARLHVHAPNLDVNVKCPDDEPIKACVDAVSQLMDKANTQAH